jgi:AraC-like DNA-binding protein
MPPGEYVFHCRIATAKTMLLNDDISMDQVAKGSGFSSQSYFNYCFKQETGQTPLQYRREMLSRKEV